MYLLREFTDIEGLVEESTDNTGKKYYITGKYMQSDIKNRNGRFYPKHVIEQQVEAFQPVIAAKKSIGELAHPSTPNINHERVCHVITELKMEGKDAYGKSKILTEMPMGKIVKTLIDEGIPIGVSSRGMGALEEKNGSKYVSAYQLVTVDVVSDPSAPEAWMEPVLENTDWFFDGTSWQKQEYAFNLMEEVKRTKRAEREAKFLQAFKKLFE